MKKTILIAGIALVTSSIGFAQSSGRVMNRATVNAQKVENFDPNDVADKKTERLDKIVTLSPEQKEKVKAIYLKNAEDRKARVVANANSETEIDAILRTEQKQRLDEVKKERMEKMRAHKTDRTMNTTESIK